MSPEKILCTFSGRFGDILWSLPTVRAMSAHYGVPVEFAVMPQYHALIPLLAEQSYIRKAFVIPEWECSGSPFGDQPAIPPTQNLPVYDNWHHLTYQTTPDEFLASYIAKRASIALQHPVEPFIQVEDPEDAYYSHLFPDFVAVGFNDLYADQKEAFILAMSDAFPETYFVDTTALPWVDAARAIKRSRCFIGCRSSNHVLAHGLGQKMIIFEPHPHRAGGMPIFQCPWGTERQVTTPAEAISVLKEWLLN